jgi:hypothetical protein
MTWTREPPTHDQDDAVTFQAVAKAIAALESLEGHPIRFDLAVKISTAALTLADVGNQLAAEPPELPEEK